MADLRLDGHVAVVTGAGRGLGRAHAELLAARGASVVVNDPGVELDGSGGDHAPAHEVVNGIVAAGGKAVADFEAVGTEIAAAALIGHAIDEFGRLDILVNNAGVFTPMHSFTDTTTDSFERVLRVHLMGTIHNTRAAWPHMSGRGYGKIVNTVSAVGYVGSLGRLEYGVAKAAVHGFTRNLAKDSLDHGIYVNSVSPGALTRPVTASSDNFSDEVAQAFAPVHVSPTVVWLAHPDTTINGEAFTSIAGTTAQVVVAETYGYGTDNPTPEGIRDHLDQVLLGDEAKRSGLVFPDDSETEGLELVGRFGNRRP